MRQPLSVCSSWVDVRTSGVRVRLSPRTMRLVVFGAIAAVAIPGCFDL
jgi:hypothetical protein